MVDQPSYPASTAEVRRRGDRGGRLGTIRGRVPAGRKVDCRCGPGDCLEAVFERGSMNAHHRQRRGAGRRRRIRQRHCEQAARRRPFLGRPGWRPGVRRRYPEHRAWPGALGHHAEAWTCTRVRCSTWTRATSPSPTRWRPTDKPRFGRSPSGRRMRARAGPRSCSGEDGEGPPVASEAAAPCSRRRQEKE